MSLTGDAFQPILQALKTDSTTDFGVAGARVDVLGRVDGRYSSVQRVRVRTPSRTSVAYLKILKPRRPGEDELAWIDRMLRREYESTAALYHAFRDDGDLGAARPIACLPEHRALVTEEVPGRPLGEILVDAGQSTDQLLRIAARVGAWARRYQQIRPSSGVIEIAERRNYLDDRLALLQGRVFPTAERRVLLDRFDTLAERIPASVPAVAIHADLTPLNIIAGAGGRVTVLDFAMAKTGTIHHDLSHVFFHLELLAGRHRGKRETFRALQAAVLAGYDAGLSAADPLFRLMLLQHAVCHVALLAERRVPVLDGAYRWFLRRRWQVCERIPGYDVQGAA